MPQKFDPKGRVFNYHKRPYLRSTLRSSAARPDGRGGRKSSAVASPRAKKLLRGFFLQNLRMAAAQGEVTAVYLV